MKILLGCRYDKNGMFVNLTVFGYKVYNWNENMIINRWEIKN